MVFLWQDSTSCYLMFSVRSYTHNHRYTKLALSIFMLKTWGVFLCLWKESLSGQPFVSQKKPEKNERWVVFALIKRCANLAQRGRPSIWISARLSSQSRIFYFPLQVVESEVCAKIIPSLDSPWRTVPRTILPAFGALSGPNSPFSSGLPNWHFWTQVRNLRCFYENYHVSKKQRNSPFSFFVGPKNGFTLKNAIIHPRCFR